MLEEGELIQMGDEWHNTNFSQGAEWNLAKPEWYGESCHNRKTAFRRRVN